jgi:nitrogen regulatory protein P-II 1
MKCKKIVAIFRTLELEKVERKVQELGVRGVSVTRVKGYGEYSNFFSRDWMVTHARLEVFVNTSRAEEIARAIMEAAHTGIPGDGLIAIIPVEQIYRIRTKSEARPEEI